MLFFQFWSSMMMTTTVTVVSDAGKDEKRKQSIFLKTVANMSFMLQDSGDSGNFTRCLSYFSHQRHQWERVFSYFCQKRIMKRHTNTYCKHKKSNDFSSIFSQIFRA